MSVSLLPVSASPKDFKAISEKLQASTKQSNQSYSEFHVTDELSLTSSQRETYRSVMDLMEAAKQSAVRWKPLDNTTAFGTKDTNPAHNQINAITDRGTVVEVAYDENSTPTRYSYLSKTGTSTLFQENNDSIIFANLNGKNSTGISCGILFDKASHQGTIFTAE